MDIHDSTQAGPSSALIWAMMSLFALPMALTPGILSTRRPDAGGVSAFVLIMAVVVGLPHLELAYFVPFAPAGWAALYAPLVGIPVWLVVRKRGGTHGERT